MPHINLNRDDVFIVDFLQRQRLCFGKGFSGPVGGGRVLWLPSPWLRALTRCSPVVGRVWAVLYTEDGRDCVVVNRLKKPFCGLCCIHTTLHPPVAHACPMQLVNPYWKQTSYMQALGEHGEAIQLHPIIKNCNEIKGLHHVSNWFKIGNQLQVMAEWESFSTRPGYHQGLNTP